MSRHHRFLATLTVSCLALSAIASAQQPVAGHRLYVEKLAFTNAVNDERDVDVEYRERAPAAPLVLWTRLVGTQAAIEDMRRNGQLPIKHKWFVSCGASVQFDTQPTLVDEVSLEVGREQVVDKLQLEVDMRTWFDWRTWSRKDNVSPCWYRVEVVDNRNMPLYCADLDGDCVVEIKLGG